ncbi:hypothetical protein [Streptacidiphilus sp. PAMC 29251]
MLLFGLLFCALAGIELGATAAGAIHLGDADAGGVPFFVIGINLAPWTAFAGFALLAAAARRSARAREAAADPLPALQPVLARIDASRAIGMGSDLPLYLGLTVAPDGRPGYRVDLNATVNLMDMDDYRVGRIIVAAHDPDRPWRVELLRNPSAEWSARAVLAKIDSAPVSTIPAKPFPVPATGLRRHRFRPGLYAMGLGLLASVAIFWSRFTG